MASSVQYNPVLNEINFSELRPDEKGSFSLNHSNIFIIVLVASQVRFKLLSL